MTCRHRMAVAVIGLLMYGPAMPAADEGNQMFRYSFNKTSVETIADQSGNGLNGSIHGAQPVKSGDGYALAFDGENDYLEVPDHPGLRGQQFTFALWMKPTAARSPLIARKFSAGRSSYKIHVGADGSHLYCCVLDPDRSTEHWTSTRKQPVLDRWMHVAFSCDGHWLRIYIDGELATFAPLGKLPHADERIIPYVDNPINVGRSFYLTDWRYFTGLIAEVRGFSQALNPQEIGAHYAAGHPAVPNSERPTAISKTKIKPLTRSAVGDGPSIELTAGGKPRATIVIPRDAKHWTGEAARWLQHYVELATGARLEIVSEDTAPEGTLISVGHTELATHAGVDADDLKWDGGRIVVKGDHLYLIGRDLKMQFQTPESRVVDGNCRAVIMFLEEVAGIRWFLPGPSGEFIPPQTDLRVPKSLSSSFVPAIAFSSGRYPFGSKGHWLEDITPGAVANNYRIGIAASSGGHSYYGMVPVEKYFDEHPEYFALIDGKRTTDRNHLCSTNPDVKRLLVEGVKKEFARGLDVVTLGQEDGYYRCQCDECEKLDDYRFSVHHKKSGISWRDFQDQILPDTPCERLFLLHKSVIDEVHKTYPDGTVLLMGYAPTAWPSKIIDDWGEHVWVELTNQTPEYVEAWRGKTAGITGYVYWFDIQLRMGMDIHATPREAAEHLRYLYENDFIGFYHFPETNFGFQGPSIYVLGKLMGDPYLDHEALVEEYCRGVFGKAAGTMHEFFNVLYTNREQKIPLALHGRDWPNWLTTSQLYMMLYTPDILERLETLLAQAEQEVDNDQSRGWIRHTRDYFDFAKLLTEAITAYRTYEQNKTEDGLLEVKKRVEAFDEYRFRIISYDEAYTERWFPGHGHFCNWLTGDTLHESKVYYTEWKNRKAEVLKRGLRGVAIGYGGGLAEIASGYSFVREPLTLEFDQ